MVVRWLLCVVFRMVMFVYRQVYRPARALRGRLALHLLPMNTSAGSLHP
jgi:hypothetical protein